MQNQNFSTSFLVDRTPEEVFNAITNVRGWWSGEIYGETNKPGVEFTYQVKGIHFSKQKISELVPAKKVVWHVSDASLNFVDNKTEWKGTEIIFEISNKDGRTEVRFTHKGLVPGFECYNQCSNAWGLLVNGNLLNLITTGKAQPSPW